jgi:RNA polymerase sigma-70 factor (ECF subfamily)
MSQRVDRDEYLRSLYSSHHRRLLGYVSRLVLDDRTTAEDVVQETFLRAWQHADEVRPESAAQWLFTVARNVAISAHRRRERRKVTLLSDPDAAVLDEALDAVLDNVVVGAALQSLTEAHRQVLLELYFRGHSVAEAAHALEIPEGTVKSRSYYALRALRDALTERGVHRP